MKVYRGIKLSEVELNSKYQKGKRVRLVGYQSTTKDEDLAKHFALDGLKDDQVPVLLMIEFHDKRGLLELSSGCSAFPEEQEVLL